jgi:hypothetical protein
MRFVALCSTRRTIVGEGPGGGRCRGFGLEDLENECQDAHLVTVGTVGLIVKYSICLSAPKPGMYEPEEKSPRLESEKAEHERTTQKQQLPIQAATAITAHFPILRKNADELVSPVRIMQKQRTPRLRIQMRLQSKTEMQSKA